MLSRQKQKNYQKSLRHANMFSNWCNVTLAKNRWETRFIIEQFYLNQPYVVLFLSDNLLYWTESFLIEYFRYFALARYFALHNIIYLLNRETALVVKLAIICWLLICTRVVLGLILSNLDRIGISNPARAEYCWAVYERGVGTGLAATGPIIWLICTL